ncbi:RING finger protein [Entamoeba histolytica HM-3:IMSS]|uniref:Ring finger protein, putative n=2 Tax=Entamoeba histolytica TaxID=5759 RepID=M2RWX8_ENTHI|nr:ring finger protein, putative [Entamoeba histolytica KU27]EMS16779.1 RING finger protein [Entamoeba histolytica HM-3:IMSS]
MSQNESQDIICSDEVLEEYNTINSIYPNSVTYIKPNEFRMNIIVSLENEIPFKIIPIRNVPRMYMNKNEVKIKYLTPITILISYNEEKPSFQMNSLWLTIKDMIEIKTRIEDEFQQFNFSGLFMLLYEFLSNLSPKQLDILSFSEIPISREEREKNILQNNYDETRKVFYSTPLITCDVCYEEYPPSNFIVLSSCGHYLCNNCLKESVAVSLTNGTYVECPYAECKAEILPWEMKKSCPKDLIDKYENQLVLLYVKSGGDDFIVCPFCSYSGIMVDPIVYKKSTPIQCPRCEKTFCSKCLTKNHNGQCYDSSNCLEKYKSQQYYDEIVGELMTKNIKKCPVCKCPVIKSYGCNKITCICGTYFCYNCGKKIDGYEHFHSGECPLYTEQSLLEDKIHDVDTKQLDKIMEDPNKFPFYCVSCEYLFAVHINQLVIVCPKCGRRKCRHCDAYGISVEHVKTVLSLAKYSDFKAPKSYENWE